MWKSRMKKCTAKVNLDTNVFILKCLIFHPRFTKKGPMMYHFISIIYLWIRLTMHNFDCEGPLLHKIHIKRGSIMNVSNRLFGRTIYPYTYYQALYFDCGGPLLHFTQYSQKRVLWCLYLMGHIMHISILMVMNRPHDA